MAKKKLEQFDEIQTGDIYGTQIAAATADIETPIIPRQKQGEPPTKEIADMARELGKTQGRAGCRAYRFNMAFTPEIHEYIKTMARVRGETLTAFVNHVLEKSMEDNAEIYQQALKFKESL